MKKKIEMIIRYFLNVLICLVIVSIFLALYGFFQITVLNRNYANYFGYSLFEVESGSMSPTIDVKDMVVVKLTNDIKDNDIITYRIEDSFITHRAVKVEENKVITKGDYNNFEDKTIPRKSVVGKVVKVFPKFGVWKKMLLSPIVIIAVFFTMLLFSIGFSYEDKKKENSKNQKDLRRLIKKLLIKKKPKVENIFEEIKKEESEKTLIESNDKNSNSSREKININGEIRWEDNNNQDGIRASFVVVKLLNNNEVIDTKEITQTNDWKFEFKDLYKYQENHENEENYIIKYRIDENMVDGYSKSIDNYTIINSHHLKKINVSGEIKWKDTDAFLRPQSVKVKLLKDNEVIDTKEVTNKNNWKYTFAGVYKYDNGVEIKYVIDEDDVENYVKKTSAFDIINEFIDRKN